MVSKKIPAKSSTLWYGSECYCSTSSAAGGFVINPNWTNTHNAGRCWHQRSSAGKISGDRSALTPVARAVIHFPTRGGREATEPVQLL